MNTASVKADLDEHDNPNRVDWDGPNDPENPHNWSASRRWFVTFICLLMSITVTFASSAPSPATGVIAQRFGTTPEVGYLITTLFLVGYVFGPLFWGPASELVGRRPIFQISLASYTLLHLGQALAPNMATLLVTRFLAGFFAVSPLSNAGGVLVDIWDPVRRGHGMAVLIAGVFIGPVLGPIVGGFIVGSSLDESWIFWIMMIFAGISTAVMFVALPETYTPVLLLRKAQRLRKLDPEKNKALYAEHEKQDWTLKSIFHRTLYRPFHMLAVEPILLLVTLYMSLVYSVVYALFEALPVIFSGNYGFTPGETGLIFVGVGIGTSIGSVSNLLLSSHYPELLTKWKGFPPPEQRLFGAMIGGVCLVVGTLWLGWTGNYRSIPWYVPALGTIPIGASVSLIFISFLTYLPDTYLMYTASALAANTMVRSGVAAAFPLFTTRMYNKLGINWASTLIGLVALLLMPSPFLFYKYGPWLRSRSTYSPCTDLKIAEELERERLSDDTHGPEKV